MFFRADQSALNTPCIAGIYVRIKSPPDNWGVLEVENLGKIGQKMSRGPGLTLKIIT